MRNLEELREFNSGYNPEKAEDHGTVEIIDSENITVEAFDGRVSHYTKTDAKNEWEYIDQNPRQFGVVFRNKFYINNEG